VLSYNASEILKGDAVLAVYGAAGGEGDAVEEGEALGLWDGVEDGFDGDLEGGAGAEEEAPAGGELVRGDDAGICDDPEEAGGAPLDEAIEFCVCVEAGVQAADIAEGALVTLVAGALEIDGVVLLEKGVAIGDGGVMEEELALDAGAAIVENFEALDGELEGTGVAKEIGAGGFALEDSGDADGAAVTDAAAGLRLADAIRAVGGNIEAEAVIGQ
jgi:hypothetical protein